MSKPIQTVEELDAVLHWRGKHAQAIKERDALQLSLTTADNRFDTAAALLRETSAVLRGGECYGWEDNQAASIDAFLDGSEGATCTWQHVDDRGIWDTGCGTSWAFTDEGPKENGMKFCHACGKTLMVEDAGDDD